MPQPDVLEVLAADADRAAAAHGYKVSPFTTRTAQAVDAVCPWQLIGFADDSAAERAAVAWIIADAVMSNRAGHSRAYQWWREAALAAKPLSGDEARLVKPFVQPVFGLPPTGTDADDHVPGHVGEWLWYLLTREEDVTDHELALLEPPSWSVTEGGADGFAVHRIAAATDTRSSRAAARSAARSRRPQPSWPGAERNTSRRSRGPTPPSPEISACS